LSRARNVDKKKIGSSAPKDPRRKDMTIYQRESER
jgi:hypothetical protein